MKKRKLIPMKKRKQTPSRSRSSTLESRWVPVPDPKPGAAGPILVPLPGKRTAETLAEAARFVETLEANRQIARGPRIGIDYAEEWAGKPWRFWVKDNPFVSRARRASDLYS